MRDKVSVFYPMKDHVCSTKNVCSMHEVFIF